MAAPDRTLYRPRCPQTTPLYRLVQAHDTDVRDGWEEQDESRCGFWRSFTDTAFGLYLDWGMVENGFARVRCGACRAEYLPTEAEPCPADLPDTAPAPPLAPITRLGQLAHLVLAESASPQPLTGPCRLLKSPRS